MLDYKIILGILTIAIGLISYSFYLKSIFQNKTKPDVYSWLIWGLLASITFFVQFTEGGGAGTWATAFTAIMCFIIATIAFFRDGESIKLIDWISLSGALVAAGLWIYTNNALLAVILIVAIGAMGFIPTFQKAFYKPREETAVTFSLNALKFAVALFALESLTITTWLYPASLVVMNVSFAMMLFIRRLFTTR